MGSLHSQQQSKLSPASKRQIKSLYPMACKGRAKCRIICTLASWHWQGIVRDGGIKCIEALVWVVLTKQTETKQT